METRAACSEATRVAGGPLGGGSSPGEGGWVTDNRWEEREAFGRASEEDDPRSASLRRGTLAAAASRPRPAGALALVLTAAAVPATPRLLSGEAPTSATAAAAVSSDGTPPGAPETAGAAPPPAARAPAPLLSSREVDDGDADDREGGSAPFAEAPPRFLLAIPPGLADAPAAAAAPDRAAAAAAAVAPAAVAAAAVAASGNAGTVGGEGLLLFAEELSPGATAAAAAAAATGPPLPPRPSPPPAAGVLRGRPTPGAIAGGLALLVRSTSGADALLLLLPASGDPRPGHAPLDLPPVADSLAAEEAAAGTTLGAGSQ